MPDSKPGTREWAVGIVDEHFRIVRLGSVGHSVAVLLALAAYRAGIVAGADAPSLREAALVEAARGAEHDSSCLLFARTKGISLQYMAGSPLRPNGPPLVCSCWKRALAAYESAAEGESPSPFKGLDEMSRETAAIRRRLAAERRSDASD